MLATRPHSDSAGASDKLLYYAGLQHGTQVSTNKTMFDLRTRVPYQEELVISQIFLETGSDSACSLSGYQQLVASLFKV